MILYSKNISKISFFLFLIFILSIFLRFYNLNLEDLWFDEQASFLVSNPNLTHNQTILLSNELDNGSNIAFNFILKKFFELFGYNPDIGRILTVIAGILSIPALCYLAYQVNKNNGYIVVAFLSSINWYLISYSQELRAYSLLFFLSVLSIIFYFRLIDHNKKIIDHNFFLFIIFSTLAATIHVFFFIILFSQFVFLIINKFKFEKYFYKILFSLIIIPIIYLFFMFDQLVLQLNVKDFWIQQIKIDFFINFFFSRFFGSKIMGLIFLSSLIYLIITNKKIVFNFSNKYFLLILLLFFSYFLPLSYSLFKQPILIDRYIIFVLIPIFILVSSLIFEIKNQKIKFFFMTLILISSLINNYIEIFQRKISKPEFKNAIRYIINSKTNNNIFILTQHKIHTKIVSNYIEAIINNGEKNFNFLNDEKKNYVKEFWLFCYEPLNEFLCDLPKHDSNNFTKMNQVNFKLTQAILYKIN